MWYGPFYAFGKVAGFAARVGALEMRSRPGPEGRGGQEGRRRDLHDRVAKMFGRREDGLKRAAADEVRGASQ